MNKPSILIVGAGATGLPIGYHLSLAGADITYLDRSAIDATQQLYCYDDNSLKTFTGYHAVDDVAALTGRRFEFVMITLDGHTARTEGGAATLRALGDLIRPSDATVIMSAFGIGVREHFLEVLGIPDDRLLHGFLGMLAHQSAANLPIHAPTDPAKVAQAGICYRHPKNRIGFRLDTGNPAAAKRFAALYDSSGVSRCARMSREMDSIFNTIGFPLYTAWEIAGWPDFATVAKNKELWKLTCAAQREIMTLPRNGWRGRLLALAMGPRMNAKVQINMERGTRPMDLAAFNRFHHGGKVRAQDIGAMYDSLEEGRRQGRPMKSLQELLERLKAHEAANRVASPA
ncbi:2-dehydropantoate 2-reductase N-terminal domain-containing protein [Streptomyces sp. NPDC093109]|uniref:ketopantoate reductase family protein n=1 Tax=Streptomyces sp. NPDC093109 TaxID=3154977 RepID=UPI0034502EE4